MRPGRLDRILYVSPPDFEARKHIFQITFAKMAVNEDVNVDELAELVSIVSLAGSHSPTPLLYSEELTRVASLPARLTGARAPSARPFAKTPLSRR